MMSLVQDQISHAWRVMKLLLYLISEGENFTIGDAFRSREEQNRLFKLDPPVTKCDGFIRRSRHQDKLAIDILFFSPEGQYMRKAPEDKVKKYHDYWSAIGGRPLIAWDPCHFES